MCWTLSSICGLGVFFWFVVESSGRGAGDSVGVRGAY
jgi:hypothetical protein